MPNKANATIWLTTKAGCMGPTYIAAWQQAGQKEVDQWVSHLIGRLLSPSIHSFHAFSPPRILTWIQMSLMWPVVFLDLAELRFDWDPVL